MTKSPPVISGSSEDLRWMKKSSPAACPRWNPLITIVADDLKEKQRKVVEVAAKRNAREVRALIMGNRQKAQRMTKLIDPLDLTAKQLETQLLKESRTKCNRQLCKQAVNDVAYFEKYLAGLVNNFAVMHGLLRGVRLFVQKFFRLLNGERPYNPHHIERFFLKDVYSIACVIGAADSWFDGGKVVFGEYSAAFLQRVEAGECPKPELLNAMEEYLCSIENV